MFTAAFLYCLKGFCGADRYVETKTRESEYKPVLKDCQNIVDQLNQQIIRTVQPLG